jgi:hypothetical protein
MDQGEAQTHVSIGTTKKQIGTMSSTDEDYVDAVDAVTADIVVAATAITNNADSDSSDEVEACMI